jgi:hypothetical protein
MGGEVEHLVGAATLVGLRELDYGEGLSGVEIGAGAWGDACASVDAAHVRGDISSDRV